MLPQAPHQLRLVGEQGRPAGEQHLRGRLSRSRQHHRRRPQPAAARGAILEQSDATGWMAMFCLNLMRIALELAKENQAYEGLATKFFQHYIYVGAAMTNMGGRHYQLWDEEDGFFYDVLRFPDDRFERFRVRSLVGLIPLYAVERLRGAVDPCRSPSFARVSTGFCATSRTSSAISAFRSIRTEQRDYVLAVVDRRAAAADAATNAGSGRVPLTLGTAQPLQGSRGPPVLASRTRRSATSRGRRTSRSWAGTRTGAVRSGSRPPT